MIYTNNQGPNEWVQQIQTYFEMKLNYKLFDQIIKAFKINGRQVELYRTSHMKNHKDLIRCTKIPETTEICFLDDVFHPGMVDDRIYYINIKPYIHDLSFEIMIDRFVSSNILNVNNENNLDTNEFKSHILNYMKRFHYNYVEKTKEAQNIDKILSKKILHHLNLFFNKSISKQQSRRTNSLKTLKNKTQKKKPKYIV